MNLSERFPNQNFNMMDKKQKQCGCEKDGECGCSHGGCSCHGCECDYSDKKILVEKNKKQSRRKFR